ncbi:YegS/Rv2252/BmrU family lipid kinase [Isosphaeraceae bacterium EP7]
MTDDVSIGRRAALLINARSRTGEHATSAALGALKDRGLQVGRVIQVSRPDELGQAARDLLADEPDRLIVGGGDGTIATVAPLIARTGVALGVIPMGTANDFARTLLIPVDLDGAADVAAGACWRFVDLARANVGWFLNAAHVGVAAAAVSRDVSPSLKLWFGRAVYAVVGLHALIRSPTFKATITTEAGTIRVEARELVIGNGRYYGGGVLVSEGSRMDDGELVIYAMGARSRWEVAGTMALLKLQVPLDRPGDLFIKARNVSIEADPPQGVTLDGESRGQTPLTVEVVPGVLRVLAPPDDTP